MSERPALGTLKSECDTPLLCIDLDAFEANVAVMANYFRQCGVDWRPHSKCHKSPIVAQRLIAAGAIGATCAKLGEAEVLAAGGVEDILIANLIVGRRKMERLVALRRICDPIVCIDHLDQARQASEAMQEAGLKLRVIVEINIGLQRVGVSPDHAALEMAQAIQRLPGLELAGMMGYEGHLLTIEDPTQKAAEINAALSLLGDVKKLWAQHGIASPIISCGGTGSYRIAGAHPDINEIQAGGGVFMDAFYQQVCQVADHQLAMTVLTQIVTRHGAEHAVIDAGRKSINQEIHAPFVHGRDDITVGPLSAEHGQLELHGQAQQLKIGDRVEIVPGYSDLTSVLHDAFYCFRGDRLEEIWPLEGRGRLQ